MVESGTTDTGTTDTGTGETGTTPFISVIIPVWNSPDFIEKCLDALSLQDYPRSDFEVLVVDNGSTDNTRDVVARYPWVRLLEEPIAGSYQARNKGLSEARGEYLAFTDADCIPAPGWLSAAVAALKADPGAGLYGGQVKLFSVGEKQSNYCERYEFMMTFDHKAKLRSGLCVTANCMVPRALLESIGGFDARFKSGGDAEMSKKIVAGGHRLVYVHDMLVGHPTRATLAEIVKKSRRTIGGRWVLRSSNRFLRTTAGLTKVTVMNIYKVLSGSSMTLDEKLGVCGILLVIQASCQAEIFRLALGGEPARA